MRKPPWYVRASLCSLLPPVQGDGTASMAQQHAPGPCAGCYASLFRAFLLRIVGEGSEIEARHQVHQDASFGYACFTKSSSMRVVPRVGVVMGCRGSDEIRDYQTVAQSSCASLTLLLPDLVCKGCWLIIRFVLRLFIVHHRPMHSACNLHHTIG